MLEEYDEAAVVELPEADALRGARDAASAWDARARAELAQPDPAARADALQARPLCREQSPYPMPLVMFQPRGSRVRNLRLWLRTQFERQRASQVEVFDHCSAVGSTSKCIS